MKSLVITEKKLVVLVANFDDIEAELKTELERYNLVVTVDTVGDAKKLATELNSSKKTIKDAGKAAFDETTKPAKDFMERVNQLVDMVESSRQTLLAQVQKFEDETRKEVEKMLRELRDSLWLLHKVDEEFKSAEFDDLILISNITATGNLTKSAKDKIDSRVRDDKAKQDKINMRLVMLENQSFRAGLTAPLTRDHVAAFLFFDDEKYQLNLDRIITSEVTRQEATKEALRKQVEAEKPKPQEPEPVASVVQQPVIQPQESSKPTQTASYGGSGGGSRSASSSCGGKVSITVSAIFSLEIDSRIPDDDIKKELRRVMENAGIKSLQEITVSRQ